MLPIRTLPNFGKYHRSPTNYKRWGFSIPQTVIIILPVCPFNLNFSVTYNSLLHLIGRPTLASHNVWQRSVRFAFRADRQLMIKSQQTASNCVCNQMFASLVAALNVMESEFKSSFKLKSCRRCAQEFGHSIFFILLLVKSIIQNLCFHYLTIWQRY